MDEHDVVDFTQLLSTEQLELAQQFRDGGSTDVADGIEIWMSKTSIFGRRRQQQDDPYLQSEEFAARMRALGG